MVASAIAVSGCMGPTYGTDKPATQQLLEDVGNFAGGSGRSEPIAYNPRPGIVLPSSMEVLPTPQQNARRAGDGAWPESPEERLARIRAEATERQEDTTYRAPVLTARSERQAPSNVDPDWQTRPTVQQSEARQRLAQAQRGSPTTRRYLSEPPLEYRVPAESAPTDDLGTEEWRKQRDLERASGQRSRLRDWIPGL